MYTPKRLGRRAPCGPPAANGTTTAAHGVHSEEPSRQTAGSNGWKARLAAPPAPGCLVQAQFLFESPCVFAAHGRGIPLSGHDDAATQRDHRTSPSPMFTDPSDLAHASATRLPTLRRCRPEGGGWTDRDRTAAFPRGLPLRDGEELVTVAIGNRHDRRLRIHPGGVGQERRVVDSEVLESPNAPKAVSAGAASVFSHAHG